MVKKVKKKKPADKLDADGNIIPRKVGRPRVGHEFLKARELVRAECIGSVRQYAKWWKVNTPARIPKRPDRAYSEWISWSDFLGVYNTYPFDKQQFRTLDSAKSFVHPLLFKTQLEWLAYVRTGKKPIDIPSRPDVVYEEWFTWKDFLGHGIADVKRNLDAAGVIMFIIQNHGRPHNVYQVGISSEGVDTITQYQETNGFRIIGLFKCDMTFNWEYYFNKYGRPYQTGGKRSEFIIDNINDVIFDMSEFVEPIR